MYTYPIDYDLFNTEEVTTIIEFLSCVEDANENTVDKNKIINLYNKYRKIINSKSIEKQMDKDFLKTSGYPIYNTMQKFK